METVQTHIVIDNISAGTTNAGCETEHRQMLQLSIVTDKLSMNTLPTEKARLLHALKKAAATK